MIQKTSLQLIQALGKVQHQFHSDPNWDLLFSNGKNKWYYLSIGVYKQIYYITDSINTKSVEISKDGSLIHGDDYYTETDKYWLNVFNLAIEYLATVKKNWVAAFAKLNSTFPYKYRKGLIQHNIVRYYVKDVTRVDKELGLAKTKELIKLVENGSLSNHELGRVTNLTAFKFFEYCKVAYLNSNLKLDAELKALSGKELYKIFADGRHEGLINIKQNSVAEFRQWIDGKHPKKDSGGHPWEIIRGSSTSNITLRVSKDDYGEKNNYKITLTGNAMGRLAETIKIYLALYNAKLPVHFEDPKEFRTRLLAQDNIGIVPDYDSLHRANQSFDEEVNDVMYLSEFKNNQKQVIPLVCWEMLPCLVAL
jgi:hypothetical protein